MTLDISGKAMDRTVPTWTTRRKLSVVLAAALVCFSILGVGIVWRSSSGSVAVSDINTAEVVNSTFFQRATFTAKFDSIGGTVIAAPESGIVQEVLVPNGAQLTKGDPIMIISSAELDDLISSKTASVADVDSALQSSILEAELAAVQMKRTQMASEAIIKELSQEISGSKELYEEGFLPRAQLEELNVRLENERKKLEFELSSFERMRAIRQEKISVLKQKAVSYRDDLGRSFLKKEDLTVRTNISGRVFVDNIEVGSRVASGTTIANVKRVDEKVLVADVDEFYFRKFSVGQEAEFELAGNKQTSTLMLMEPQIREGAFRAQWAPTTQLNDSVQIGQTVTMNHYFGKQDNLALLPVGPFLHSAEGKEVFVIGENGMAIRRNVDLGQQNDEFVVVKDGLEVGDVVVISDYSKLNHLKEFRVSGWGG